MNKSDYITLVNSKLPDGGNIPSTDHRDTMHTDANSVLELVYGDSISDSETIESHTTSNSNFDYDITLHKTGNTNIIIGKFTANNSVSSTSTIFTITNSDFFSNAILSYATGVTSGSPNIIPIYIQNSVLKIDSSIVAGEGFKFSIIYKSLN
tara:strand:+ start:2773 stop:3228 length:456 start_codon:yes stop_codon:yes gene_type:complete